MATAEGVRKAIEKLHNFSLAGRRLTVHMAGQPKAAGGYQSWLGAFTATGRSPQVNTLTPSKPSGGYESKLGAFGQSSGGPPLPRRRGGNQRH